MDARDADVIRRRLKVGARSTGAKINAQKAMDSLDALVARLEELERERENRGSRVAKALEKMRRSLKDEMHPTCCDEAAWAYDLVEEDNVELRARVATLEAAQERVRQALLDLEEAGSDPAPLRIVLYALEGSHDENLAAQVDEASRILKTGDNAAAIAYLLGRPVEDVRSVLPREALEGSHDPVCDVAEAQS